MAYCRAWDNVLYSQRRGEVGRWISVRKPDIPAIAYSGFPQSVQAYAETVPKIDTDHTAFHVNGPPIGGKRSDAGWKAPLLGISVEDEVPKWTLRV
jgi:hypothetical protein